MASDEEGICMHIHLLSDIHLEFADFTPAVSDVDETILAGDIAP